MNIAGLSKAKVLAALFNAAMPLGMGFLHYKPEHVMDEAEAEKLLEKQTYFDYIEGRVVKVNLEGDEVWTANYNRDNGVDAAENIINAMRQEVQTE